MQCWIHFGEVILLKKWYSRTVLHLLAAGLYICSKKGSALIALPLSLIQILKSVENHVILDVLPVNFEELFIYELESRGENHE